MTETNGIWNTFKEDLGLSNAKTKAFFGNLGKATSGVLGVGQFVMPAIFTEGGMVERGKAALRGAPMSAAWLASDVVMRAIGGGLLKSTVAGLIASEAVGLGVDFTEHLQGIGSRGRGKQNWGMSSSFYSRKAYTMRQQSLEAMNRGQMSARNLMGQEASILHQ